MTLLILVVARHQANHARIQFLRAEAEALEEQLKTSVSTLAGLRYELFETPATTFPAESRPVHFDELLQYAKTISAHTVPPTYREHAPEVTTEKDKGKEDATSAGAPTNGVNTPANAPDAMDTSGATPQEPKDSDAPANAPADLTAEEEEWLKKLKDSKIAWYPWPSEEKICTGNLYKNLYWQARGENLETFNVHAEEERMKNEDMPQKMPEPEIMNQEPVAAIQGARAEQPVVPSRPAQTAPEPRIFNAFDDFED